MKKNILNLEGVALLTKEQQKKINGGHDLTVYDPDNPCQNFTEITPSGCPCNSSSYCSRTYGPGAIGSGGGPATIDGKCVNGSCA